MTVKQFFSFGLPFLILGGAACALITKRIISQSDTCDAPTNPQILDTSDGSASVGWTGDASGYAYLVWARDSSRLDSVVSSLVTMDTKASLPGLLPNHGYAIDIFGMCRDGQNFSISKNPITIGTRTGWIVNEDVYHFPPIPDCPFDECDTLVTDTDTCFNCMPVLVHYSIEVYDSNGLNLLSRYYMKKDARNDTLFTQVYNGAPCEASLPMQGTAPLKNSCNPVNPVRYCGTVTLPGPNPPVSYFIETGFTGCCISLPKSRFKIIVRRCRYAGVIK